MKLWGILCVGALLGAATVEARAQSWDGAAAGAVELSSHRSLAALFWSDAATCAGGGDDLAARQCKGIRAARKAHVATSKYLVRADASALVLAPGKDKRAALTLRGCLACAERIDVGGKKLFVVAGAGNPTLDGSAVVAPTLGVTDVPGDEAWRRDVLPRLRAELVVSVGASPATWKSGSADGYKVSVVGYRVVDPCEGKVLMAEPKSASVKPDKRFCTGKPVAKPVEDKGPEVPKEPELPAALTSNQIRTGLEPARDAARKCFDAFGISGTALFRITISNDGAVVALVQKGDFKGTPTGTCVEKAVKEATFPKSKKRKTTIDYPFILR
ncbi:MAG TPA: hypothetical protein VML75_01530 [Kofleriaceae bacterium]|nr:hypothetical protein [Kofleriaceae bacterium]